MTGPKATFLTPARPGVFAPLGGRAPERRHVCWALLAGSIVCFVIDQALSGRSVPPAALPVTTLIAVYASASCGLAWLLARALFRSAEPEPLWPRVVVIALVATGAVGAIAGGAHPALRIAGNAHALLSSTVLLLTFVEAFHGYGARLKPAERRFRLGFAAGYGALVTAAVLWVGRSADGSLAAQWGDAVKMSCALVAVCASGLAVRFRDAHPAPRLATARPASRPAPTTDDHALAEKVMRLLDQEQACTTPNLKVADVARMVGEADYKVTQCITRATPFSNFNRLVNHLRIEHAKRMLGDPRLRDRSILSVAMDCGFGSIGPFNRAFKEQAGVTPRVFKAAALGSDRR